MNIDKACVECIINQSIKVSNAIGADKYLANTIQNEVTKLSKNFSFENTPPEIASYVYQQISTIAQKEDLYDEVKQNSTKKAISFISKLREKLHNDTDKLLTATKIAIAGNVIDLAAEVEFDLSKELQNIFHTDFDINNFTKMKEELQKAKSVVILGDNVGEHIFDYLFIETLKKLYPNANYYYMVRGKPIINDVTMKEAKEAGFHTLCNLIDSGVDTPGFAYSRATQEAKDIFDNADLVISKGMGNYESLTPIHRKNICFLLKVKCEVVAKSLNAQVGNIVCKID
jgi:uncharacterized protein with ATP-grasp and redox domains